MEPDCRRDWDPVPPYGSALPTTRLMRVFAGSTSEGVTRLSRASSSTGIGEGFRPMYAVSDVALGRVTMSSVHGRTARMAWSVSGRKLEMADATALACGRQFACAAYPSNRYTLPP